ncbi:MAG TPA: hypothetical protein VFI46_04680 [Jiangellaceae bacterium]|nr:hypothetical protein [Jiangellaceae bacterium]
MKLIMRSEHPESWTTLLSNADRFDQLHKGALMVRQLGGVQPQLPGAAPRLAWRYRAWKTAAEQIEQLKPVAPRAAAAVRGRARLAAWVVAKRSGRRRR